MARTLRDAIAEDISAILNPDEFAATVEYLPLNGRSREISAMVERHEPESLDGISDRLLAPRIVLWVANDPDTGIASERVNTGGDQVRISAREGKEEKARTIIRILSHTHAALQLEVR